MYSHCIFCNGYLGRNDRVEQFPVGRRVIFDEVRGRLWAACPTCSHWNLSPIEQRLEAIESCIRLFERAQVVVKSDNIALGRISKDFELLRLGTPTYDEFAAWRYGDQFGLRRRRAMRYGGAVALASGVSLTGFVLLGAPLEVTVSIALGLAIIARSLHIRAPRTRLNLANGRCIDLTGFEIERAQLTPGPSGTWSLRIPQPSWIPLLPSQRRWVTLANDDAISAAGRLLQRVNSFAATADVVRDAVTFLRSSGSAHEAFARAARMRRGPMRFVSGERSLAALPRHVRLALEMCAIELHEQVALRGEARALQEEWRQSEEIASIADDLFDPPQRAPRI